MLWVNALGGGTWSQAEDLPREAFESRVMTRPPNRHVLQAVLALLSRAVPQGENDFPNGAVCQRAQTIADVEAVNAAVEFL